MDRCRRYLEIDWLCAWQWIFSKHTPYYWTWLMKDGVDLLEHGVTGVYCSCGVIPDVLAAEAVVVGVVVVAGVVFSPVRPTDWRGLRFLKSSLSFLGGILNLHNGWSIYLRWRLFPSAVHVATSRDGPDRWTFAGMRTIVGVRTVADWFCNP